jgi:crotonobetainyl-CoA:carnitine CoA-transferase CaiB-like acyl-CoA transferase
MTKTVISYRRIDHLKAIALERGFRNEDAKQFGKLSKTATWEALLKTHGIPLQAVDSVDRAVDTNIQSHDTSGWTNDGSFPVCNFTRPNSSPVGNFTRPNSSFLDWVDFGQLAALVLASAGVFVLAMSMWRQINPLNLFPPVKVNIQIGTKL